MAPHFGHVSRSGWLEDTDSLFAIENLLNLVVVNPKLAVPTDHVPGQVMSGDDLLALIPLFENVFIVQSQTFPQLLLLMEFIQRVGVVILLSPVQCLRGRICLIIMLAIRKSREFAEVVSQPIRF